MRQFTVYTAHAWYATKWRRWYQFSGTWTFHYWWNSILWQNPNPSGTALSPSARGPILQFLLSFNLAKPICEIVISLHLFYWLNAWLVINVKETSEINSSGIDTIRESPEWWSRFMHEHLLLQPVVEMIIKKNCRRFNRRCPRHSAWFWFFLLIFSVFFLAQHSVFLKRYWDQVNKR